MPTLVILRHAEAVPSRSDDHARPLTQRGRADAASSGRHIQSSLKGPLLVLASDARRTKETAELAFEAAEPAVEIRTAAALYSASVETLLTALRAVSEASDAVALVGHNPGLSTLAKKLFAGGSADDEARVDAGLPTAGVAIYAFDEPWSKIDLGTGRLIATLAPDGKAWSA